MCVCVRVFVSDLEFVIVPFYDPCNSERCHTTSSDIIFGRPLSFTLSMVKSVCYWFRFNLL